MSDLDRLEYALSHQIPTGIIQSFLVRPSASGNSALIALNVRKKMGLLRQGESPSRIVVYFADSEIANDLVVALRLLTKTEGDVQ